MIQTVTYDATFDGLLTVVFTVYELKLKDIVIQKQHQQQQVLFGEVLYVMSDKDKADRVWKKLKEKTKNKATYKLYAAFLSETQGVENIILQAVQYILASKENVGLDYGHPAVLKISKLAKSVGREKHRMEAFVRFKLTKDGVYFAVVSPDFDVLSLISNHFKNRYADQQWIIYDWKRNYGLFYDLHKVEVIHLEFNSNFDPTQTSDEIFAPIELEFQQLWKDYFKSTNIESRKNTKLHIQHVPKRYWKYLSEKQP
ncbi:TIGR03915 family putative DNA repair protein [Ochrovirga pacifica]|uniref:TIGR03915 family putative DNA repair protein n=1 Tax=Ochrovirga pacifica TaxID=1042376 RepID=UPI0002558366|nr:TIGR03915 family putative DNA repair protein [Ochrovirga pacifica]